MTTEPTATFYRLVRSEYSSVWSVALINSTWCVWQPTVPNLRALPHLPSSNVYAVCNHGNQDSETVKLYVSGIIVRLFTPIDPISAIIKIKWNRLRHWLHFIEQVIIVVKWSRNMWNMMKGTKKRPRAHTFLLRWVPGDGSVHRSFDFFPPFFLLSLLVNLLL